MSNVPPSVFRPAAEDATLRERLAVFPFAAAFSPAAFSEATDSVRPAVADAGTVLVDHGDACDPLVLVERGVIRVFERLDEGREITLYHVAPGEACVLAVSGALSGTSYPATAVAAEDLTGLSVGASVFRNWFDRERAVRSFVLDLFANRLAKLMVLVQEVAFHRMDRRLARLLLDHATIAEGLYQAVRKTHVEIARELGTAREVVTRLLRSFESDGLLDLGRGTIRVKDPDGLRRWLA